MNVLDRALYRGKRVGSEKWEYGFLSICEDLESSEVVTCITKNIGGHICDEPVKPETVGQFTGLTDKNGVKVFEGDIINRIQYINGEKINASPVLFHDDLGYDCSTGLASGFYFYDELVFGESVSDYSVIGNIHDNPELIEISK